MRQQKHTRKRPKASKKAKKQPKRAVPWKKLIGLASLAWSVFRFLWEHGQKSCE